MEQFTADLTNCDREPIHIPGAIQPHGVLIAFDSQTLKITHASQNAAKILGLPAKTLIGTPVENLFLEADVTARMQTLMRDVTDARPVYLFTLHLRNAAPTFDAIAHRAGHLTFIEFELTEHDRELSAPQLYRLVQQAILRLQRADSVEGLCNECAIAVQKVNGFDRVMVYRFDQQWNGQVVAEAKREDLEPFLGLHYPASDIPKQARELYTKNWLRFIPDRDYEPSAVVADAGANEALDMSFAVLRSVSPIHIEYLRNMGVGASMSISLIHRGKLWGLIACHHYSPRFVPYDVRTACELLGQVISLHLDAGEEAKIVGETQDKLRIRMQILENIAQVEDTATALIDNVPNMMSLIDCDGAAVVVENRISRLGQTPGDQDILEISKWINAHAGEGIFSTDNLQSLMGNGVLTNVASGLLSLSVTTNRVHQLLWFRTERLRTVNWAGDPAKSLKKGDGDDVRLSPRGSFALWKQTVQGYSNPWTASQLRTAELLHQDITRLLLRRAEELGRAHTDLRLASSEREKLLDSERAARSELERVNRMKDDFVATLSHELRTPLNAIFGWSQLLIRQQGLDPEVAEGLNVIERNARSQSQMINDLLEMSRIISGKLRLDLQYTHLPTVIESAIETVALAASSKDIRIEKLIDPLLGVETTADPDRLQQVVWNLLSNAVKFTPKSGRIQVVLSRVNSHVELSISDNGIGISPELLPHVFDRFRQAESPADRKHGGLGLGLSIVRNLVELHGGTVRAFSPGPGRGTTFMVSLPVRIIQREKAESNEHPTSQVTPTGSMQIDLTQTRILVVDDEPDARELVKRILQEHGSSVVTASSKATALSAFDREKFDVIVSDIGMPEGNGYELIQAIRESEAGGHRTRTPAIALTAFARPDDRRRIILAGFQAHVAKPVESGELIALVASLAGRV